MNAARFAEAGALQLLLLLAEIGIGPQAAAISDARCLVIAAHPDDETLGATWILRRARDAHILYVTDGAPIDRALWSPRAPTTRRRYAALRAKEARQALALAGIAGSRIGCLGVVDQQASDSLVKVTMKMERVIETLAPALVVVQPYEGGHPDHDATAFAVHAAVRRMRLSGNAVPQIVEMTSYHRWRGGLRTGAFLPDGSPPAERILSEEERRLKAHMIACFASQSEVLASFTAIAERFRRPPPYDFRIPPHAGLLYYESLGWPMTGVHWRRLASTALEQLGLVASSSGSELEGSRGC
jgi:LmbE family N-acetylglucosaminyl deacetylase